MKLRFLWIGETKNSGLKQEEEKYLARVRRHLGVERLCVAETRKSDPRQVDSRLKKEAELLDRKLGDTDFLVVLDESGQQMTSAEWAGFLGDRLSRGETVAFVVGGYLGLPDSLKRKADKVLSLSRMTLPHELARVVLLEQVYRAIAILRGLPYHK